MTGKLPPGLSGILSDWFIDITFIVEVSGHLRVWLMMVIR